MARLLEAIVADPSMFPDLPPRIGLYQCFLERLHDALEDPAAQADEIGTTAARSLAALPPAGPAGLPAGLGGGVRARRGRADPRGVRRAGSRSLLDQASKEIGRQIATDVLIIEDEPLIALDLERILEDLGHRVTSIARTHKDALKAAALQKPGLVLADIRLADGSSGLDAVNDILGSFTVPVVFITAYPEKLMTGERPEPTFLITKPFREDAVKAIVSQVLFFDQQARRRTNGRSALTS